MLIPLTKDQFAIIDDADCELVSRYSWQAQWSPTTKSFYARGRVGKKHTLMHRLILKADAGQQVDHRNGNSLDNRRDNLRKATNAQNVRNGKKRSCNSSGYIGVHLHKKNQRWVAYVGHGYHINYLGSFATAKEAARVRDAKAIELHGEFARLNFPQ